MFNVTHRPLSWLGITAILLGSLVINDGSYAEETDRPNVILILTDDMRNDFLSIEGHPYLETPNIDRLAKEGTLFTRCYVTTPQCGPNRASMNTGLLSPHHGIINHSVHLGPEWYPEGNFLPRQIHDAGNQTAMIGKWFHSPQVPPRPEYDRWFVHAGTEGPFYQTAYTGRVFSIEGLAYATQYCANVAGSPTTYATDIEFYEAARWAGEVAGKAPFFQFVSPFAPHGPFTAAERHDGIYDNMAIPDRPNFYGLTFAQELNAVATFNNQCEMLLAVDEGVGHLYNQLETSGILEDTIIIFTSDNGMHLGEHGFTNTKKTFYEEACRVPFIVRYGSNVKGQGPVDRHQLMTHADLMMTIVELMGGTIPKAAEGTTYYGRSMANEWLGTNGKADVNRRDDIVMLRYHNNSDDNRDDLDNDGMVWGCIVTDDGWKYADINLDIGEDVGPYDYGQIVDGLTTSLFNVIEDPYELDNRIGRCDYQQLQLELKDRLTRQLSFYDAEFKFAPPELGTRGDINQDNSVDLLDILPFVDLVVTQQYQCEADVNSDGMVDVLDVDPFVSLLNH